MKDFKVSVITPVYNAENFLTDAVESAINLEEVGEIILVEDNSPDNALKLCEELSKKYEKVKLLTHPNNENRGAGASRNLGIRNANFDFISFLDADDLYMKSRFIKDKNLFKENSKIDAIYNTAVVKDKKGQIKRYYGKIDIRAKLLENINPVEVYKQRLKTPYSLIHTNAVTFKKTFLIEDKLFDERLLLHQDSELWKRSMRRGNFFAGELKEPVAEIREHTANRISHRNFNSELKLIAVFIDNVGTKNLYDFEVNSLYERGLRKMSMYYNNTWERRFNFYTNKVLNSFNKRRFLEEIREKYKDLEI